MLSLAKQNMNDWSTHSKYVCPGVDKPGVLGNLAMRFGGVRQHVTGPSARYGGGIVTLRKEPGAERSG